MRTSVLPAKPAVMKPMNVRKASMKIRPDAGNAERQQIGDTRRDRKETPDIIVEKGDELPDEKDRDRDRRRNDDARQKIIPQSRKSDWADLEGRRP